MVFSLWLESGGSTPIISLAGLPRHELRKQELSVSPLESFQQLWFLRKHSFPRASFRRRERQAWGRVNVTFLLDQMRHPLHVCMCSYSCVLTVWALKLKILWKHVAPPSRFLEGHRGPEEFGLSTVVLLVRGRVGFTQNSAFCPCLIVLEASLKTKLLLVFYL